MINLKLIYGIHRVTNAPYVSTCLQGMNGPDYADHFGKIFDVQTIPLSTIVENLSVEETIFVASFWDYTGFGVIVFNARGIRNANDKIQQLLTSDHNRYIHTLINLADNLMGYDKYEYNNILSRRIKQ